VLLAINWSVDSEIIEGWKTPNLYGLLFVGGLVIGYFVVKQIFKKENISNEILDKLVMYMVLATIIGARLGHVLFYGPYFGPDGYFSNPLDIFKVWEGGLASHGAAIALLISLYLFSRNVIKKPFLWVLDRLSAAIAIGCTCIRLGNLVNHEMVGDPTNVPWAFKFQNYWNDQLHMFDPTPRHPAQLYEAICYFIAFLILLLMYWKMNSWKKPGFIFGSFLIFIFGSRFFIEYIKEGQTPRDFELLINTGQMLSIPFIIAGIILIYLSQKNQETTK
jgi:phosphatidylglycerol---prolipoprotein diacylglyceryl transferase